MRVVSFSSICGELFIEMEKDKKPGKGKETVYLQNYINEQQKHINELFQAIELDFGLLFKNKKTNTFEIPENAKDSIKEMLRRYTSKGMKCLRRKDYRNTPLKDRAFLIQAITKILIEKQIPSDELQKIVNDMYKTTQFPLESMADHVKKSVSSLMEEEINRMQSPLLRFNSKEFKLIVQDEATTISLSNEERDYSRSRIINSGTTHILGTNDRVYMMGILLELLTRNVSYWRDLLKTVCDLRSEEIDNISLSFDGDDESAKNINSNLRNVYDVVAEAMQIMQEEK